MAKKKENQLTYLQSPLPEGRRYQKMTKRSWGGLNYRQTIDTGALSMERNISTLEAPYLVPSQNRDKRFSTRKNPIGLFGFDDFLLLIYRDEAAIKIDYIVVGEDDDYITHTGILQASGATDADDSITRCVVQFNVYDTPTDPVTGQYIKKLLFFPDKASMFMKIVTADSNPTTWSADELAAADPKVMYCYVDAEKHLYYTIKIDRTEAKNGEVTYTRSIKQSGGTGYFQCDALDVLMKEYTPASKDDPPPESASHNYYYRNSKSNEVYRWVDDASDKEKSGWKVSSAPSFPNIKYAAVHMSRLFGVDDDRVYASGYNDYTNWNLDTVGEYNESNAWCSPAQSNTKAGGKFTGITNFQGHVVCFKSDYMHEIYNTKNPFRIQDVYAEGAVDHRTIQDVDGRLIFVSEDAVKIYTGSNPRVISYNLNITQFTHAVSGTDGRCYYLYCEEDRGKKHLFVYDTFTDYWSEQTVGSYSVLGFAHIKNGMYVLCRNSLATGTIYRVDSGGYGHEWSFETDLITNETVNIKHLKKLQMLVDIPESVGDYANDDAYIKVYALYDDEKFNTKTSQLIYTSSGPGRKAIRVKPRKTANYGLKLRVEGYGYIKLYEMELFIEAGGDLYA